MGSRHLSVIPMLIRMQLTVSVTPALHLHCTCTALHCIWQWTLRCTVHCNDLTMCTALYCTVDNVHCSAAVQWVATLCYIVLQCATLCYIVLRCAMQWVAAPNYGNRTLPWNTSFLCQHHYRSCCSWWRSWWGWKCSLLGKQSSEKNDIFFSIVIGHSVLNSSTFWKASKDSSLAEIVR